ncbi:MAG: DUF2933 domain-containing protein [Sphingomonadaceae bacterium]
MHQHSGNRHMMIMLLCCLIPMVAVFAVTILNIPLSSLATYALVALCPLLHIFMMKGMLGRGKQDQPSCHDSKQETPKSLPERS